MATRRTSRIPSSSRSGRRRAGIRLGMLLFVGPLAASCGGDGGQERIPLDGRGAAPEAVAELPSHLQLRIDSANTAYRARDYREALRHFTEVTREAPELAAGWYGVGMTQAALGDAEAADSAMMRVHRLAPDIPLQHPGSEAPPNPHPVPPPER